jgi:hypothetical protein
VFKELPLLDARGVYPYQCCDMSGMGVANALVNNKMLWDHLTLYLSEGRCY